MPHYPLELDHLEGGKLLNVTQMQPPVQNTLSSVQKKTKKPLIGVQEVMEQSSTVK